MARLLHDVIANSPGEHDVFLFSTREDGLIAGERRDDAPTAAVLAQAAQLITEVAFAGEAVTGTVGIEGRIYNVIAVPVTNDEGMVLGVLTVGVRLGAESFQQLRLPRTEVLLMIGGSIAATSFDSPEFGESVLRQWSMTAERIKTGRGRVFPAEAGGEHFLGLVGDYGVRRKQAGIRYMLLSSYEPRLRVLGTTRLTLLALGLGGILGSGVVVSWFVRRVTRPLRELRDSAEAVGRGDFSRRVERFSNDEVGDLAQEFNRMTTNLQTSRAELERAMQTVKTTQEQLFQREKLSAVGQFVAGVAHELNNPLTSVVGFSELVQTLPPSEVTHGYLGLIAKSAMRCHKIVQSLLSFARQQTPERRLVQLHAVLEDVLEIMAYDLRTSGVTVVREFEPTLPLISVDSHQLQQVFVNILSNARQAMEAAQRDCRITIRTATKPGFVTVEFEDNGPGIRPENLARIFDPFFTTKPVGKGTGLGLSLCYGIIQEHGGKISVRSEQGGGAIFAIDLPAVREDPSALVRSGNSAAPFFKEQPQMRRSVLVIDDEPWILELAQALLIGAGHEVEIAESGEQGLELIGRSKFDVIVSDWKMPGLNGVRLYEHLVSTNPDAARRVMFMTGDVMSDTFQSFLIQHDLTCLSKPFAAREFRAAVAKMFTRVD